MEELKQRMVAAFGPVVNDIPETLLPELLERSFAIDKAKLMLQQAVTDTQLWVVNNRGGVPSE